MRKSLLVAGAGGRGCFAGATGLAVPALRPGAAGGVSLAFREGVLTGGGSVTAGSSCLPQALQAMAIRVRAMSDFFMDFPFFDGGAGCHRWPLR
jgi:hypothetical protein